MIPEQLHLISVDIYKALAQFITGKLLTEEQIKLVSNNIIGTHFTEWLPLPKDESDAKQRVEEARTHISAATRIISGLQTDLEDQALQLEKVAGEIEEKKKIADRYAVLARANQETLQAFKVEMEESLRKEIRAELIAISERGKHRRQAAALGAWLFTLIAGAALGAYFPAIINYLLRK